MSLNIPTLDDRPYETILRDARNRIPVYSEAWTDHNASDPGITVLELLAWLAETYAYQLDQITDAHRLKYLALLGERPRPPQPASTELRVTLSDDVGSVTVHEGTKLRATTVSDEAVGFETTAVATLTRATVERVVIDGPRGRRDQKPANQTPGMQFPAFGERAVEDGALYLGFGGDPFGGAGKLALTVRLAEDDLPPFATHGAGVDACPEAETFEPTVKVRWEHCPTYEWTDEASWKPLSVRADETNQFYRSGRVVLEKPRDWQSDGGRLFDDEIPYCWIRCRVTNAGHEIAPRIDTVAVNVVPVEHRRTVRSEDGEPLRDENGNTASTGLSGQRFAFDHGPLLRSDVTVRVGEERWHRREDFDTAGPHSRCFVLEPSYGELRFGDGARGMIPPVDAPITATRYVGGGGLVGNVSADATWAFEGPGVRFRDETGTFTKGDPTNLTIEQVAAATGGAEAESIEDAFDRLVVDRRVPYRAVTASDYEYLATHTPGLRFGRAAAWVVQGAPVERPGRVQPADGTGKWCGDGLSTNRGQRDVGNRDREEDARNRSGDDTGAPEGDTSEPDGDADDETPEECEPHRAVNVVVVPYSRSSRPEPSEGFLDAVDAHLQRHRLLTDRVEVNPPRYVEVGVDVAVGLESAYAVTDRSAAVDAALDDFLDPLHGFEGDGWPFGRAVYRSELYEVVESVPGVDCVTRLAVRTNGRTDPNGTVVLDNDTLVTPTDHTVTARVGTTGPTAGDCDRP